MAIDSLDRLIVTDRGNNRVQVFTLDGLFIQSWGGSGIGDGEFYSPAGVATDSNGNIYVSESISSNGGSRVQKFSSNGEFLLSWGEPGVGLGQFQGAADIAVDSAGDVYVVDVSNNRDQKFDSEGVFISAWGNFGAGDGQFNVPWGITIDSSGRIIVADSTNKRIQVFEYR
ncbi:MAG: hypothetical protein O3B95_00320 [Chloroflexi bacterium]|nr:hypothetical protein [Chloroflexota bacterium]